MYEGLALHLAALKHSAESVMDPVARTRVALETGSVESQPPHGRSLSVPPRRDSVDSHPLLRKGWGTPKRESL